MDRDRWLEGARANRAMVRQDSPEHAEALDHFRDQLLIVCLKRLAKPGNQVVIPVAEVDDTGGDLLAFAVRAGNFVFELRKKT